MQRTLKQLRNDVQNLHERIGTCDIADVNTVRAAYFADKRELEERESGRAVAIQDGTHKVLSGEMTAGQFFKYFVDQTLFDSRAEYVRLVNARAKAMLA